MKLTGAQIIWECLVRQNVKYVFGYPLGKDFRERLYGIL